MQTVNISVQNRQSQPVFGSSDQATILNDYMTGNTTPQRDLFGGSYDTKNYVIEVSNSEFFNKHITHSPQRIRGIRGSIPVNDELGTVSLQTTPPGDYSYNSRIKSSKPAQKIWEAKNFYNIPQMFGVQQKAERQRSQLTHTQQNSRSPIAITPQTIQSSKITSRRMKSMMVSDQVSNMAKSINLKYQAQKPMHQMDSRIFSSTSYQRRSDNQTIDLSQRKSKSKNAFHKRGATYGSELKDMKGVNLEVNLRMNSSKIGRTQMLKDFKSLRNFNSGLSQQRVFENPEMRVYSQQELKTARKQSAEEENFEKQVRDVMRGEIQSSAGINVFKQAKKQRETPINSKSKIDERAEINYVVSDKQFQLKDASNSNGYMITQEEDLKQINYINKNQRQNIIQALNQAQQTNKLPVDLFAELKLKQQFLETQTKVTHKQKQKFIQLVKNANVPGNGAMGADEKETSQLKEKFMKFNQKQLRQQVLCEDNQPIMPKALRPKETPEKAHAIQDLISGGNQTISSKPKQDEDEQLPLCLEGKVHILTEAEEQRNRIDLQKGVLESLSCLDQGLKIKILMNIDTIQQDMTEWRQLKDGHVSNIKSQNKTADKIQREELIPDHEKNKDMDLQNMIFQMDDVLNRIHLAPTHHQLMMPINEKDQIINNIHNVRDQQHQLSQDLSECLDCVRKIFQKQSLLHQNTTEQASTARLEMETFDLLQEQSRQNSKTHTISAQKSTTQRQQLANKNKTQLYDMFNCNQITNMAILYLLTVINKSFEMQQLCQTRFRLLAKRQNQVYREQCTNILEDMHVLQQMSDKRFQKKIDSLDKHLTHTQAEVDRLLMVIREKDDEINLLLNSTNDDVPELKAMIKKFNQSLVAVDPKQMSLDQNEKVQQIQERIKSDAIKEHTTHRIFDDERQKKSDVATEIPHNSTIFTKAGVAVARPESALTKNEDLSNVMSPKSSNLCPKCGNNRGVN